MFLNRYLHPFTLIVEQQEKKIPFQYECMLGGERIVLSSSDPIFVFYQTKFNVSHFVYGYIFIYVIFRKLIDFIPAVIYALVLQQHALLMP